ncbi:hypothetical protein GMOD_00001571 [Pyrenophora seminiperda CCB06]|uniref:Uncharacterized protein n=1 Tax=Pyrenophora seminiperda CCB06 TaxID=1302712 RepID=A0A3M7LZN8_9PLEO|nr:hypothetical protein GMOD_00001571 [Pyrenophora seminiperda CCB06]
MSSSSQGLVSSKSASRHLFLPKTQAAVSLFLFCVASIYLRICTFPTRGMTDIYAPYFIVPCSWRNSKLRVYAKVSM